MKILLDSNRYSDLCVGREEVVDCSGELAKTPRGVTP